MRVISIQSQVVHGYVGNSAAVFPMQAAGIEVAQVPTTLLSNHPHYPTMRGWVLDAELVEDLLQGVEERGLAETSSFLLTGYLGSPAIARVVADFVVRAKARNPALIYVCDPVMGDTDTGVYVADGIREVFAERLVPLADIITPNQFELGLLAGRNIATFDGLAESCAMIAAWGCPQAVITGCRFSGDAGDFLETIIVEPAGAMRIQSPRLPVRPAGTGDLMTACMIAALSKGRPLCDAVAAAVERLNTVLQRTVRQGGVELAIIERSCPDGI